MKFDLECAKHPEYKVKNYPYSGCEACRTLYWLKLDGLRSMSDGAVLRVVKTRKKP
jgi:hypothetical protein